MANKMINIKDNNNNKLIPDNVYGSYVPVINHATISEGNCSYVKIGRFVYVSFAIWCTGDGSDEVVRVSLPFPVASARNYGVVGYFINSELYPNLHCICTSDDYMMFEYSKGENVTHITGKEISTFQCSIQYISTY